MTIDEPSSIDAQELELWATDPDGPVALHLRQTLLPVDGEGGVIFPPTYTDIGYNIDELWDGQRVATIDSLASQANRMEPIFQSEKFRHLVPQIRIRVDEQHDVSIFDASHRLADALVRSTDGAQDVKKAFRDWAEGNGASMARLGPTSIVFGAWDSRGEHTKLPRLVSSTIRAYDVKELRRSGQYIPPVDYAKLEVFSDKEQEKAEGKTKNKLAQQGFVHVPHKGPGGIVARGPIHRDVTINLVALRQIPCNHKDDVLIRPYILGLCLVAATHGFDPFLRSGCLLTLDPAFAQQWVAVMRDGTRRGIVLDGDIALAHATKAAEDMKVPTDEKVFKFTRDAAKELIKST